MVDIEFYKTDNGRDKNKATGLKHIVPITSVVLGQCEQHAVHLYYNQLMKINPLTDKLLSPRPLHPYPHPFMRGDNKLG